MALVAEKKASADPVLTVNAPIDAAAEQKNRQIFSQAKSGMTSIANGDNFSYIRSGAPLNQEQQNVVRAMGQLLLKWYGYTAGTGASSDVIGAVRQEIDSGRFGAATEKLLKQFQSSVRINRDTGQLEEAKNGNGLTSDGVFGVRTLAAMAKWVEKNSSADGGMLGIAKEFISSFSFSGDKHKQFLELTGGYINEEDAGFGDGGLSVGENWFGDRAIGTAMKRLLGTIKSHEANGNYNAANRGRAGDTPGGIRNLTQMTIGDVMRMQAEGQVFAVGAYQLIPRTLAGAVSALGLSRDQLFDEKTQDKLGLSLILGGVKRPALTNYLMGRSNNLAAAERDLCNEWACFIGSWGGGAYDGDLSGNMGTVGGVKGLLQAARQELSNRNGSGV